MWQSIIKNIFLIGAMVPGFLYGQTEGVDTLQSKNNIEIGERVLQNTNIYLPHEHPLGRSQAEWGVEWVKYLFSFNCENFPLISTTRENFELNQNGPVYFLVGSFGGKVERSVKLPAGKAVFFPVYNYFNHYPCPYPGFKPAPGQSMEDFLKEGAAALVDLATNMSVTIDEVQIDQIEDFRFTSRLFYFNGNPELVCMDPCVTTGPQPAIVDGYWIMIKPLHPGKHRLHFHSEVPEHGMVIDVTYQLNVE